MEAKTEWKIGGGGGGGVHTLQPHSLGTWDKCPHRDTHPNFRVLVWDWDGGTKVFYPPRPDYMRFKIPSFTSPAHTHSHVCDPTATFSFCRRVICYQLGINNVSFVLFQRFRTSIPEDIYTFVLFHAGGSRPDPQVPTPLDPRMNKRSRTMKLCRVTC